jgi:hypothetical protein
MKLELTLNSKNPNNKLKKLKHLINKNIEVMAFAEFPFQQVYTGKLVYNNKDYKIQTQKRLINLSKQIKEELWAKIIVHYSQIQ